VAVSMDMGAVRRATPEDLDALFRLDGVAPGDLERRTRLNTRVRSGEVILFERDGYPSGYAIIRPRSFFGCDFVESIMVAADDRRFGIGSLLLRQVVILSSTVRIFSSTNRSNTPMTALLHKESWQFSGQLEGIDVGDPEMVYYKDRA